MFLGSDVSLTLYSLHGGSLEITSTVPSNKKKKELKNKKFSKRKSYNFKKNCYQVHVERAGGYCDLPPPSHPFYTDAVYYFYVSI